jgi:hypothetical protein
MDPSRLVLRASFHRSCLLSPLLIQRFLAFGGTERSVSSNPRRVPRTRTKSALEQYCSPGCTPDRPSLAETSARRTPNQAPAFPRPKGIRSENHTSIDRGDCFRILPHPTQSNPIRSNPLVGGNYFLRIPADLPEGGFKTPPQVRHARTTSAEKNIGSILEIRTTSLRMWHP